MPLRRTLIALLAMALLISVCVAACGTSAASSVSPNQIAKQVGAHYGDAQAQVAGVRSTESDQQDPMYLMTLTGRFHKGSLVAVRLGFSALADRMYVWHISAFDQAGNLMWFDRDLTST